MKRPTALLVLVMMVLTATCPTLAANELYGTCDVAGWPADRARDPPAWGDWIVSGEEVLSQTTVQLYGNLTVLAGGKLRLTNEKLKINCSFDGEYHVEVQNGGELIIEDADNSSASGDDVSELSSPGGAYLFWVRPGGKLTLRNSVIRNCGYALGTRGETAGVYLQSDTCEVSGTVFRDNFCGLAVDGCSPRIHDNLMTENRKHGMYLRDAALTLNANIFDSNPSHGILAQSCQLSVNRNTFRGNLQNGLSALSSTLFLSANIFQLNKWRGLDTDKSPTVSVADEFYQNAVAVYANDTASFLLDGDYFQYNTYCIYTADVSATIRNCTMVNTTSFDLSLNRYSDRSEIEVFNSTFTNVTFGDPWSAVFVRWTATPTVAWESTGGPVAGALVRIFKKSVEAIYNLTTNASGSVGPLVMTQYEQTKSGRTEYNPYRFGIFQGRYFNSTLVTVNRDQKIELVLDDVSPRFVLQAPRENFTTNRSRIEVTGNIPDINAQLWVNGTLVDIDQSSGNFSDWVNLREGRNTINITAVDGFANVFTVLRNVTRDSTPPALTVNVPGDGLLTNEKTFRLEGTTEARAYVKVNGQISEVRDDGGFSVILELAEGENQVAVFTADQYQNGIWVNRTIISDTISPRIDYISPLNGSVGNRPAVTVSGSTEETADVYCNETLIEKARCNFTMQFNLTEGENILSLRVVDRAGNSRIERLHLRLDTVPPAVNLVFPSQGASVAFSPLTIVGTSEPGVRVNCKTGTVRVLDDGSFTVLCNLSDGQNNILVELRDVAGNVNPFSVSVTYDTIVNFKLDLPVNLTRTSGSRIWVEGTTEPGASVRIGDINSTADANGSFRVKFALSKGSNNITVTIKDAAGNTLEQSVIVIREDAPGIDLLPIFVLLAVITVAAGAGAFYYLVVRPRQGAQASCKKPSPENTRFILKAPDEPEERLHCGACLEPIEEYWTSCHSCGASNDVAANLTKTIDKVMETEFASERELKLKGCVTDAFLEMNALREEGTDVSVYVRDLALAAQLLLRRLKPELAEQKAGSVAREVGDKMAKIRANRATAAERVETQEKELARQIIEQTEPELEKMKSSGGGELRELEKLLGMAKNQLRAGNVQKAYKYAKKVQRMVEDLKDR